MSLLLRLEIEKSLRDRLDDLPVDLNNRSDSTHNIPVWLRMDVSEEGFRNYHHMHNALKEMNEIEALQEYQMLLRDRPYRTD